MRPHKKEDIVVLLIVLIATISFTIVKDPSLTGYAVAYYRIYGLSDLPGEELPDIEGNSAPIIYYHKPIEPILRIARQDSRNFYIEKTDPDLDDLTVTWYLNSQNVKENSDSYTFEGKDNNLGNYNITVVVSDGSLEDSKEWLLELTGEIAIETDCGKCCGVVCEDSSVVCPDSYLASCTNRCNRNTGECSSCAPTCAVYPESSYLPESYNIEEDRPAAISRRTVPCINITSEKKKIAIKEADIKDFLNMPKGYSMILAPFNIDCNKENIGITLSIPKDYSDIKTLRCKGINCYPTVTEKTKNLECGGKVVKEFTEKAEYLDPELVPVEIKKASLNFSSFKQALKTGNSQMWFYGDAFTNLSLTIKKPEDIIEEAKNPNLRILNILDVKIKTGSNVNSVIEMPYLLEDNINEDNIRMYVKTEEGWSYLGGSLNKEKKIVKKTIENIQQYLDQNKEVKFALMGPICINCLNSTFKKIYEPKLKTREAVLLVHGFTSTPLTYQGMIDDIRLTEQPFQLWVYGYPSTRQIEPSTKELAGYLQSHSDEFDTVYIVSHSLGGLIVQQALYYSKNHPEKYDYLDKIQKLILVAVPNEGASGLINQKELFNHFVNIKTGGFFESENPLFPELVEGIITPKIEGISYYVIAGTKPFEFNLPFFQLKTEELFGLYEKNDGVITVKSAQRVGDEYINDMCNNYWEINLTHTGLIHEKEGRELIQKILSEELISKEEQASILGANQYFELKVADCSAEDKYVVIGKKIRKGELRDPTGCSCGNGICGEGEDRYNCPLDCGILLIKNKYPAIPYIIGVIFLIITVYRFARMERLKYGGTKRLMKYIHDNYNVVFDGISPVELKKELRDKGFSDRLFDDVFKLIYSDFFRKYLLLEENIQKKILNKVSKNKVKKEYMEKGWEEDVIDKAIHKEVGHLHFRKKEEEKEIKQVKGEFFGVK